MNKFVGLPFVKSARLVKNGTSYRDGNIYEAITDRQMDNEQAQEVLREMGYEPNAYGFWELKSRMELNIGWIHSWKSSGSCD